MCLTKTLSPYVHLAAEVPTRGVLRRFSGERIHEEMNAAPTFLVIITALVASLALGLVLGKLLLEEMF
jgi:hypothetical protein